MRTSDMDMGTSGLTPNLVLKRLREANSWGRPRLAREMHNFCATQGWSSPGTSNLEKQIYRLESGRVQRPDPFYSRLYCQFFGQTARDLFGEVDAPTPGDRPHYQMRSHKFVPIYVGASVVEQAGWTTDGLHVADYPESTSLYSWRCGVLIFHIVEAIEPGSVADIAVWRQQTYPENIADAVAKLSERGFDPLSEPYVLSAYWVNELPSSVTERATALRILAMPRVLTRRGCDSTPVEDQKAHASLVEQNLLRDGFAHPEIVDFGIKGISTAFASWSGVVYHPLSADRAILEEELVDCELKAQAAWSYCDFLRSEVEDGRDPAVPQEFGWRYLRGLKSRLTTERPTETSQHRGMREAIVNTSGLHRRLDQALEFSRD